MEQGAYKSLSQANDVNVTEIIYMKSPEQYPSNEDDIRKIEDQMDDDQLALMYMRLEDRGIGLENYDVAGRATSKKPISELEQFALKDKVADLSDEDLVYLRDIIDRNNDEPSPTFYAKQRMRLEFFGSDVRFRFIRKLILDEADRRGIVKKVVPESTEKQAGDKDDIEF